ncbi:MAG: two-component system response regulator [Rhodoferax sp.]|nr:two-component system response regulator [Rhodoferax sp.]
MHAAAPFPTRPMVLVVDDEPENLALADDLLSQDYTVKVAPNGARALKIAQAVPAPDIILLDVVMPGMGGYEVCRQLKGDALTRDIPVIFLTAKAQLADEQQGFEAGAVDYIAKPISPPILMARLRTHLALKAAANFLLDKNHYLEQEVARRTEDVRVVEEATILAMTSLAETRDNETGNHILRTQRYVKAVAQQLQSHPRFCDYLQPETIELLFKSAPLHDIGKVGIPDRILLKPGPLDADEFTVMKTHTSLGFEAISRAMARVGRVIPFLQIAAEIALSHQEKWDGSGYPQGLVGDAIPVSARLMAVADVYDALISKRVYKKAMSHAQAAQIIQEGRGRHFDPDVVDAFLAVQATCLEIAIAYSDGADALALLQQAIAQPAPG